MPQRARNPVKATRTSFRILEELADEDGIGVTELAKQLDLSKGSVSNHLATLQELGYVAREDSQYFLGCQFLRLGTIGRSRHAIAGIANDHAQELANVTGERSVVTVAEEDYATYLYTAPGDHNDTEDIVPGLRVPLHCTAPGKAILAHLSEEYVGQIVSEYDRRRWTDTTITDLDELTTELGVIREQGLAFNRGEYQSDRNGLAAPILSEGRIQGAVGIVGPKSRVSGKTLQQDAAGLVVSVAKQIETDLKQTTGV